MAFIRLAPCTCDAMPHEVDCKRRKQQEETDKRIKEILENMPTLEELMGGGKKKGAKVANLKNPGDFIKGVITEIVTDAPVFDYDTINKKMGLQKYWVDGKPKGVPEQEAKQAGLNPVHQMMITIKVTGAKGVDIPEDGLMRFPVNTKDEREGFKSAVIEAGGSIDVGDTIGKRLDDRDGNVKHHEFKVTPKE